MAKYYSVAGWLFQTEKSDSDGWEITQSNGHKHLLYFAITKVTGSSYGEGNYICYNVTLGNYTIRFGKKNQVESNA